MNNKQFLLSIANCYHHLTFGERFDFRLSDTSAILLFNGRFDQTFSAYIYDRFALEPIYRILFNVSKRRIQTLSIEYTDPTKCKYSPTELRRWSPAAFLPCTNYQLWVKYLGVSIDIFNSKRNYR